LFRLAQDITCSDREDCSLAEDISPQFYPASTLEQFLTVASGVVVRWEDTSEAIS